MKRLLCYAHFDAEGEVKSFVKQSLRSMAPLCESMCFVSNSPLPEGEIAELGTLCRHIQVNDNVGYDFGMWQSCLQHVNYREYDEVVLMNSSIYGPIGPIEPLFEEMSKNTCDFWGITESFQIQQHVQSYFLVFKKQVVESPRFAAFWDGVLPYRDKSQIIMNYEVGLTRWLRESGFRADTYCNFYRLAHHLQSLGRKSPSPRHNFSIRYAVELLELGNPFLKVEPIKKGELASGTIAGHLAAHGYAADHIRRHENGTVRMCPACGGAGSRAHKRARNWINLEDRGVYDYYQCRNSACGVLWLWPVPGAFDFQGILDGYRRYARGLAPKRPTGVSASLAAALNAVLCLGGLDRRRRGAFLHGLDGGSPGRLLEIGSGGGERLRALNSLGWDVVGVDPLASTETVSELRRDGIELIPKALSDADLSEASFDVVLLPGQIGRVPDSRLLLEQCLRFLKPGGEIRLSTPNSQSITRSVFGRYWLGLDPPRQRVVYNRKALKALLVSAGFRNPSIRNRSGNTEMYAMHSIDGLVKKWIDLHATHRLGGELLPLCFQLLSLVVTAVANGRGEECFAVASKPR